MFMYLVSSFEMSAMIAMGKIKNPVTGTTDRDLKQAQFSIDILDMLKEKTAKNIDEYESRFLENVLGQLKLNYLDESEKDKLKKDEPEAGEEPAKNSETSPSPENK
jgi:hypothetical protein